MFSIFSEKSKKHRDGKDGKWVSAKTSNKDKYWIR